MKIENVKATASYVARDSSSVWVGWEKGGCRYHIWINERNGKVEPIEKLFKNPPDGVKTGQDGYFSTRVLKPFNAANKTDVELALKLGDVEKAKSEYILKEHREQEQREQDARDRVARDKLNAAAPRLLAALIDLVEQNGGPCEIARAAIAEAQP